MRNIMKMDNQVMKDKKLKLKYNILNKVGEGSFGQIYKAINRKNNCQVALKIEFLEQETLKSNLALEIRILNNLQGVSGVPKIYSAGKWEKGIYMEMELLECSLQDQCNKEFSIAEINHIATQVINILKRIHQKGVIHQDLKPHNLMRNDKGNIVIIDFGLSNTKSENTHFLTVNEHKKKGFIGTPRYASIAAHKGQTQTPKDDLQSLMYVLGFLYFKKCPWLQLKGAPSERMEKILKFKTLLGEGWMQECGTSFSKAYSLIRQLSPHQTIDYSAIVNIFQQNRFTGVFSRKNKNADNRRRMSDNVFQFSRELPNFLISNEQNMLKNQQISLVSSQIVSSNTQLANNNFSQTGQDNFHEFLRLLTDKVLEISFEEAGEECQKDDCQEINEDDHARDLTDYTLKNMKNPFYLSKT